MKHYFVLGVHPSSRGFGWALFEGPLFPFDWGTVDVREGKNRASLARFQKLLERYEPSALAIEAFDEGKTRRSVRVQSLCRKLIELAESRGTTVHIYTRDEIGKTFAGSPVKTREDIAAAVAERVAVLRPRLPSPRKAWQSEHPSAALFAASACALTYLVRQQP